MSILVNINGEYFDQKSAKISVFDRGFLSGDAVFEVIRTYGGKPFMLKEHLDRMKHSAEKISLSLPHSIARIGSLAKKCCQRAGNSESMIRVVVTRGEGPMTLNWDDAKEPNLIIIVVPLVPYPEHCYRDGVSLFIVGRRKIPSYSLDPRIKSNGYLLNILAQNEARKLGGSEAILLNHRGEVAECTQSNLFAVIDGELLTPPLSAGILGGITRQVTLKISPRAGSPCRERIFYPEDLYGAQEVFITSTRRDIMPVAEIDGKRIGTGKPGKMTQQLMREFERFAQSQR